MFQTFWELANMITPDGYFSKLEVVNMGFNVRLYGHIFLNLFPIKVMVTENRIKIYFNFKNRENSHNFGLVNEYFRQIIFYFIK